MWIWKVCMKELEKNKKKMIEKKVKWLKKVYICIYLDFW